MPGPAGFWEGEWLTFGSSPVTADDVEVWPYSVGLLVRLVTFFGTLHWPAAGADLGGGGVSFVEILIFFFELWAGERLELEKACSPVSEARTPTFSVGCSVCPGTDFWPSCRFPGALVRALRTMPGGLGRFLPCDVGADHCRLRHLGWEKCGHGLTSRPRESASEVFLNELLVFFRYPPRSAATLLGGTLPPSVLCGEVCLQDHHLASSSWCASHWSGYP